MPLIRIERVTADSVLEAQEFRAETLEFDLAPDGTLLLHFRADEGHPSLTVMLDSSGPEGEVLRKALAA